MESYKEVFRDEAQDLLVDLEKSLLSLEKNPQDEAAINQVFRVMHTLKGNSSMFGFQRIEEITHLLENVYDEIRETKYELNEDILGITLETLDHIRQILTSGDDDFVNEYHFSLLDKLQLISNSSNTGDTTNKEQMNSVDLVNESTYLISFKPNADFLEDGSNPLYLIEDLCSLGETKVIAHYEDIPQLSDIKPTQCYVSWTIILATKQQLQEILDIFIFAEHNSELNVQEIASHNLLEDDSFSASLEKLKAEGDINQTTHQLIEKIKASSNHNGIEQSKLPDNKISSIRVSSDKLDQLMNLVSELVTLQARFNVIANQFDSVQLESVKEEIEKLTRQLRENTLSICLIPINSIEIRFQRLIRDLSKDLGKEVQFNLEGGATELDKNIIESLSEPLLHILRNSLDHGIETPENRISAGKDECGIITLKAYYSGANVFIEIIDDGAGIDPVLVRKKGVEKGLISDEDQPSEKDIYKLLFNPGFSTSENVTNVSGRGVGMDVVKRKIEYLQGEVTIDSQASVGTKISIKLPLSLSIIDGLLVSIGNTKYVLPIDIIDTLHEVPTVEVSSTFNHLIELDGLQTQFINLRRELQVNGQVPATMQIVLVKYEDKKIGLCFDKLLGEYQAVLKPLGKLFDYQEFISGATILGDGSVALILDTNKVISQLINKQ